MARRRAHLAVAAAVAAVTGFVTGCGSSSSPRPSAAPLDPTHLRTLPSQGLVVERGHDVVLVGLDGRSYGRLVGFRLSFRSQAPRDLAYQEVAAAVDNTLLVGPGHRWYLFDPAENHLVRLTRPRVELSHGATIVGHSRKLAGEGVVGDGVSVERGTDVLVATTTDLHVSGDLVATHSFVLDLATGTRWRPGVDCPPAAVEGHGLLALCDSRRANGRARLLEVSPTGAKRALAEFPAGLYADRAAVSPDGRWVAAMLAPGCGPPYTFVVPAAGGAPRLVTGERAFRFRVPSSTLLGWSADGRVVVDVERSPDCESEAPNGIQLIDPGTLDRTRVYRDAWALWGGSGLQP